MYEFAITKHLRLEGAAKNLLYVAIEETKSIIKVKFFSSYATNI